MGSFSASFWVGLSTPNYLFLGRINQNRWWWHAIHKLYPSDISTRHIYFHGCNSQHSKLSFGKLLQFWLARYSSIVQHNELKWGTNFLFRLTHACNFLVSSRHQWMWWDIANGYQGGKQYVHTLKYFELFMTISH